MDSTCTYKFWVALMSSRAQKLETLDGPQWENTNSPVLLRREEKAKWLHSREIQRGLWVSFRPDHVTTAAGFKKKRRSEERRDRCLCLCPKCAGLAISRTLLSLKRAKIVEDYSRSRRPFWCILVPVRPLQPVKLRQDNSALHFMQRHTE